LREGCSETFNRGERFAGVNTCCSREARKIKKKLSEGEKTKLAGKAQTLVKKQGEGIFDILLLRNLKEKMKKLEVRKRFEPEAV